MCLGEQVSVVNWLHSVSLTWWKRGVVSRVARWVLWKGFRVYLLYVVLGSSRFVIYIQPLVSTRVLREVSLVTDPLRSVLWSK